MILNALLLALREIRRNLLRAFLTVLGIVIGVAAVVTMVTLGNGATQMITTQVASLGSNLLIVMPGSNAPPGTVRLAAGSNITLTNQDAKAISKQVAGICYVLPAVSSQYQVIYGNQNWKTSVQGTTPDFLTVRNYGVSAGSFFSHSDDTSRARVAVLGQTVATNLFGAASPVGKTIRINQAPFRVVGVLSAKGQSSMGQDQDDVVIVPLTTAQERLLGITYVRSINIQVSDAAKMDQAQSEVETLLRQRHHIIGDKEDDFSVRNLTSLSCGGGGIHR